MDNLYHKVKLYLEANSKTWDAEKENIELRNDSDGNGPYIKTWDVSGVSKPTDSQLNSYTANATVTNGDIIWMTTGTGTFANPTVEDAIYTPSSADIDSGSITLIISATGTHTACDSITVFDQIILDISPNEEVEVNK